MSQLEDLVRFENANSGLAFREHAYQPNERSLLLRDVVALANAAVTGPRFLFLGVRDAVGGKRVVAGITEQAWVSAKEMLGSVLGGSIEPPLKVAVRALRVEGVLVGMLCLTSCDDQPYLLNENASAELTAGCGWVRRGTQQFPLLRLDLQRMFEARFAGPAPVFELAVGFPGDPPQSELTLPALALDALPSALAAQKLHKMLEAKDSAKALFGKTITQFSRLVHAQVFGVERGYENHSDDSLRMLIDKATEDSRVADEHYQYEVRAHKLEVVVCNSGTTALQNAVLRLTIPRIDGIGVAERLYANGDAKSNDYPLVTARARAIQIETGLSTIPPGGTTRAFREAPRLWVRPSAAGKSLAVGFSLHARDLREPLRDTLLVRLVQPGATR